MKVYQLGTMVTDIVSGTEGMLTHLQIDMDEAQGYIFQPKGLNPETMQPVDRILISKNRIQGGIEEEINVPVDLLGSNVEDIATEFKGKVIGLVYHLNGCLHLDVKPSGTIPKTGSTIQSCEFDIRRMKGDKIKPLPPFKLKKSIKDTPSPAPGILNKINR